MRPGGRRDGEGPRAPFRGRSAGENGVGHDGARRRRGRRACVAPAGGVVGEGNGRPLVKGVRIVRDRLDTRPLGRQPQTARMPAQAQPHADEDHDPRRRPTAP